MGVGRGGGNPPPVRGVWGVSPKKILKNQRHLVTSGELFRSFLAVEKNLLLRPTVYVLIYFGKLLLVQTNSMSRNTANTFVHRVVEQCMGRLMINSLINED